MAYTLKIIHNTARKIHTLRNFDRHFATKPLTGSFKRHRSIQALDFSIFLTANRPPFTVRVNFDANESSTGADTITNEGDVHPGGIIGFKITYTQMTC